ncbi:MAG: hypothetical protein WCI37_01910 [bacterium]
MKKYLLLLLIPISIAYISSSVFAADSTIPTGISNICASAVANGGTRPGFCTDGSSTSPQNPAYSVFSTVLNILSWAIGIISVIVIIVAGIRMITSNGDSKSFSSARDSILYAAIGIVVFAVSQIILYFVISKL